MTDETTPTDLAQIKAAAVAEWQAANTIGAGDKPGWKTSEFWTHLLTQLVGGAIVAWGMYKSNDMLIAVGGVITGGSQLGYALARTLVKRAQPA